MQTDDKKEMEFDGHLCIFMLLNFNFSHLQQDPPYVLRDIYFQKKQN